MYSRKVKKKKDKSNYGSSNSGWGPRIALEEQEQLQHHGNTKGHGNYGHLSDHPTGSVFKNPYANIGNRSNGNGGFILCQKGSAPREPLNKPLTVVIPALENGHRYDYAGQNYRAEDSLPSTETWRSTATEDNQNDDNDHDNQSHCGHSSKDLETVEVSVPNILVDSSPELKGSGSRKSRGHIYGQYSCQSQSQSMTDQISGSMISAQGITMVYVPMERSRKPKSPSNASEKSIEPVAAPDSLVSNGIALPATNDRVKDADADSLLESLESVIFKPKFSGAGSSCSSGSSNHRHEQTPPALPPKNRDMGQSKKSLRFSDLLDIKPKSPLEDKVMNDRPRSRSQADVDAETLLSCGHARDNYSTLSSIASSQVSFTERQGATAGTSEVSETSALQQLRDLSILIGGSFHEPHDAKGSPPEDVKIRKSSTATSADSGKGSAGTQSSSGLIECNDPPSNGCSCGESNNNCIFRPECQACMSFFKNPYEGVVPLPKEIQCTEPSSKRKASFSSAKNNLKRKSKFTKNPKTKLKAPTRALPKSHLETDYCDCPNCECRSTAVKGFEKHVMGKGLTKTQILSGKQEQDTRKKTGMLGRRSPGMHLDPSMLDAHLFTIAEEDERRYEYGLLRQRAQGATSPLDVEERRANHLHPKCWLAPDPNMGWSDLESLYSQNMKLSTPLDINGECWTCWEELTRYKHNTPATSNTTMDRTKRMFIWLNRRPKEFNAPWWEAKKQASIKWLIAKALPQLRQNSVHLIPFRESKKDRTKLRLKEEVIGGLVSGKLYTMSLFNLYHQTRSDTALEQQLANSLRHGARLTLWEIIRILSRKGIYVAQPSDMKLTEGTLRQRKPLRVPAHIALIEAIMGLYAKELLCRDRVELILSRFGLPLGPDTLSSEELAICWINSAVTTIQAYILMTNKLRKTLSLRLHRWLKLSPAEEIRDLSDGVGVSAILAVYFNREVALEEIAVPEPDETLSLYDTTSNHALIERIVRELIPQPIHHLTLTDFLYVHGHMKQNLLAFIVDLFTHLELRPGPCVNRLAF